MIETSFRKKDENTVSITTTETKEATIDVTLDTLIERRQELIDGLAELTAIRQKEIDDIDNKITQVKSLGCKSSSVIETKV